MKFLKKAPLSFWILLSSLIIVISASYFRVFDEQELLLYDLRFKLRPAQKTLPDIVIIEIADDTLKNLSKWPLPRDFHASLVGVLHEYGAKVILFDILFSEPTLYDEIFAESLKEAGNVYLSTVFDLPNKPKRTYLAPAAEHNLAPVSDILRTSAKARGHINSPPGIDGKRRRIPLFIRYKDELVPHLALKASCDLLGLDSSKVGFQGRKVIIDDELILPVSFGGRFFINYPDIWERSFKHFSYFGILKAYSDIRQGKTPSIDLNFFKDKICFVGLTAAGTSDFGPTPLESVYPMVGLQASVLNSILTRQFIRQAPAALCTIINLVVFGLALFFSLRFTPLKSFLANAASGAGYFLASTGLFIFWGVVIDLFFPLFIIGFTYAGSTLYRVLQEIRRRELLEKELDIARTIQSSFLPTDIHECAGVEVFYFFQPAKFVAGDLYDVIPFQDDKLGVFIGDVSGKGVPASLIMAQTVSLFRLFARSHSDPAEVLTRMNTELSKLLKGRFVTALYVVVDAKNRSITASCAGHSPIVFYDSEKDEVYDYLPDSGPPLGVLGSLTYDSFTKDIRARDKFVLETDGVTEARNKKGQEYGEERLKKAFLAHKQLKGQELLGVLKGELFEFSKGVHQHDDITYILVEVQKL